MRNKTVCVVTGTRADYGLIKPLLKRIIETQELCLRLVVTGMHLCSEFGYTVNEIKNDGIPIDEQLETLMASDNMTGMTKSTAVTMLSFADYFDRKHPDILLILGDRFEIFACATAAAFANIPIAHLYGGDTTQGAVDEFLRHSITKMSYLHFPSTEQSRNRIIQLGEDPDRVYNVGALSVENIQKIKLYDKNDIRKKLNFAFSDCFGLVTFHPVTLDTESCAEKETLELLQALDKFPEMSFILTKANADANGRIVNEVLSKYANERNNCILVESLGLQLYLSAMKSAAVVIGNSSSGIYEAPGLGTPTVNIGNRQNGRVQSESIINCNAIENDIINAIIKALSKEWVKKTQNSANPYGDGTTSDKIVKILQQTLNTEKINVMKKFYDLPFIEDIGK